MTQCFNLHRIKVNPHPAEHRRRDTESLVRRSGYTAGCGIQGARLWYREVPEAVPFYAGTGVVARITIPVKTSRTGGEVSVAVSEKIYFPPVRLNGEQDLEKTV
jgi:hypothetical protein